MTDWKPKYKELYDRALEMKVMYDKHPTLFTIRLMSNYYKMTDRSVRRYLKLAGVAFNAPRIRGKDGRYLPVDKQCL